MRLILAMIISLQFVSAPVAAELGQANEVTSEHLANVLAQSEAKNLQTHIWKMLTTMEEEGTSVFLEKNLSYLNEADQGYVKGLIEQHKNFKPKFQKTSNESWELQSGGQKIVMSLSGLYQSKIELNGKLLSFANLPLTHVETEILSLMSTSKTTYLQLILDQFAIGTAYANPLALCAVPVPFLCIAVAVIVVGVIVYKLTRPTPQELVTKLLTDCQGANSSPAKKNETDKLVVDIMASMPPASVVGRIVRDLRYGKDLKESCNTEVKLDSKIKNSAKMCADAASLQTCMNSYVGIGVNQGDENNKVLMDFDEAYSKHAEKVKSSKAKGQ